MKNIYLIGAGGHCKSCIDVVESTQKFQIKGLFDVKENVGKSIGNYKIIGTDEDIKNYVNSENEFLVTLGQIKSSDLRVNTAKLLADLGAINATVISPRAYVSSTASIGIGTIIMHDVLVNSYGVVGDFCILNTKALIEHDSVIENYCHISTGAIVNGNCHVKQRSFVGSLSVLQEGLIVPEASVLGAGKFHKKSEIQK